MEKVCNIKKCLGCFACKSVCPQNAIAVSEDDMGKTIPQINSQKCVDCGLCKNVCPINKNPNFHKIQKCYAAYTKNEIDQTDCASGGLASAFSRKIFERGGVIVGAVYENSILKQKLMSGQDDWEQMKGSKYVQSFVDMSYCDVKSALVSGIQVIYFGTPCQIDGLYGFLKNDYSNLLTVDLICHGTPPMKYLQEYCGFLCGNQHYEKVSFRGKYDYHLAIHGQNSILYNNTCKKDIYYKAFLEGLIFRDNCYKCPYAKAERVSDITIGDFWGLDRSTLKIPNTDKISVVLVQTEKGLQFLDEIKDELYCEERPIAEAMRDNTQLCHPSVPHRDRSIFVKNYPLKGFVAAVKTPNIKKDVLKSYILETKLGKVIWKCLKKEC